MKVGGFEYEVQGSLLDGCGVGVWGPEQGWEILGTSDVGLGGYSMGCRIGVRDLSPPWRFRVSASGIGGRVGI